MKTLSVCMIVKDEHLVLDRCLSAVIKFAEQIVVVDTGSTDDSVHIARRYTDEVYNYQWNDNFADARNYSFSFATCDYVMWLDADDVVDDQNIERIIELKNNLSADCYMLRYNVGFNGDSVTHSFYRERILKNNGQFKWEGCVHECITPSGKIEYVDIAVSHRKLQVHDSDRNLNIYLNKLKTSKLNQREQYYFARELYYHGRIDECIDNMEKFVSQPAFVENTIDGLLILAECYVSKGDHATALNKLYTTFNYDIPRANTCCKIGDIFLSSNKYNMAIYWFKCATNCPVTDKKGGFVENECYNFYPYIQMCVCYYNMGDNATASMYNELAGKYRPNDSAVISNRKFFDQISKS